MDKKDMSLKEITMNNAAEGLSKAINTLMTERNSNPYKESSKIEIDRNTYIRCLNANIKTKISITTLALLANYYEVSTDYLLGRTTYLNSDIGVHGAAKLTGLKEETISTLSNNHLKNNNEENTNKKATEEEKKKNEEILCQKREFIDFIIKCAVFDEAIVIMNEMITLRFQMQEAKESQRIDSYKKLENMKREMSKNKSELLMKLGELVNKYEEDIVNPKTLPKLQRKSLFKIGKK